MNKKLNNNHEQMTKKMKTLKTLFIVVMMVTMVSVNCFAGWPGGGWGTLPSPVDIAYINDTDLDESPLEIDDYFSIFGDSGNVLQVISISGSFAQYKRCVSGEWIYSAFSTQNRSYEKLTKEYVNNWKDYNEAPCVESSEIGMLYEVGTLAKITQVIYDENTLKVDMSEPDKDFKYMEIKTSKSIFRIYPCGKIEKKTWKEIHENEDDQYATITDGTDSWGYTPLAGGLCIDGDGNLYECP